MRAAKPCSARKLANPRYILRGTAVAELTSTTAFGSGGENTVAASEKPSRAGKVVSFTVAVGMMAASMAGVLGVLANNKPRSRRLPWFVGTKRESGPNRRVSCISRRNFISLPGFDPDFFGGKDRP